MLTKTDRLIFVEYLTDPASLGDIKPDRKKHFNRKLWLRASGGRSQLLANKGYYTSLTNSSLSYPNYDFQQVDLDVFRTFPHIKSQAERRRLMNPLKNLLYSYVKRNPTVGYCQGMNFIAANLLDCMPEEEAFWTLCQVIEQYLPLEYYSNMLGAIVDQKVLQDLVERHMPHISEHFAAFDFNLDLLSFQWLVCLYSGKLREETVNTVWGLFFLQGIGVIFRVALTIIRVLEDQILEMERFDEILMLIQNFSENEFTPEMLLANLYPEIPDEEIRQVREKHRVKILEEIKNHLKQSGQRVLNANPRITFIKKFFSFNGFADYFGEHKEESERHTAAW